MCSSRYFAKQPKKNNLQKNLNNKEYWYVFLDMLDKSLKQKS